MNNRGATADYPLLMLAFLLSAFGVLIVYSAGQTDVPVAYVAGAWKRQLAWMVVAIGTAWLVSRSSVRLLEWIAWPAYLVGLGLLAVTL